MRLKLVLCASSLAAIVGAGLCIACLLAFFSSVKLFAYPSLLLVSTFLLPTAAIVFASIFVYRHTSRRRKLQAFMTAILATTLTIAFLVLASILSARREEPPAPISPVAQDVRSDMTRFNPISS